MSAIKKSSAAARRAAAKAAVRHSTVAVAKSPSAKGAAGSVGKRGVHPQGQRGAVSARKGVTATGQFVMAGALGKVDIGPLVAAVTRRVHLEPRVARELRDEFRHVLEQSVREAARRVKTAAKLVPEGDEVLTTQQAADLIGVSRPFMAARIDGGDVELFQQVGNQRRVLASSVRAWVERTRERRRKAMAELSRDLDDEYRDED